MRTMEQSKGETGLHIELMLPTGGDPLEGTIARILEGPHTDDDQQVGRVIVNGKKTYIEVAPQSDWFEIRNIRGRDQVYLKFQCTGLETIYYGPYQDRAKALFALSNIIDTIMEPLLNG